MKLKEIMVTVLFIGLMFGLVLYGIDRNEKIENGEMIQVSESQMK